MWYTPGQAVLDVIRKQEEQANKQHSAMASGVVPAPLNFLPWLPGMLDYELKHKITLSSPSCFWLQCFITEIETLRVREAVNLTFVSSAILALDVKMSGVHATSRRSTSVHSVSQSRWMDYSSLFFITVSSLLGEGRDKWQVTLLSFFGIFLILWKIWGSKWRQAWHA